MEKLKKSVWVLLSQVKAFVLVGEFMHVSALIEERNFGLYSEDRRVGHLSIPHHLDTVGSARLY